MGRHNRNAGEGFSLFALRSSAEYEGIPKTLVLLWRKAKSEWRKAKNENSCVRLNFPGESEPDMLFSKEYVGYLARDVTNKLIEGEFIETSDKAAVLAQVNTALLEELTLEDRINDEVRMILETYSDEMQRSGANYQEMFKKIKNELVRKYKAVL